MLKRNKNEYNFAKFFERLENIMLIKILIMYKLLHYKSRYRIKTIFHIETVNTTATISVHSGMIVYINLNMLLFNINYAL